MATPTRICDFKEALQHVQERRCEPELAFSNRLNTFQFGHHGLAPPHVFVGAGIVLCAFFKSFILLNYYFINFQINYAKIL